MGEMKHVFGPVPSRRLGRSLGISPIPKKTCNYSCVYCQLGRTNPMTATPQAFYPVEEILDEFVRALGGIEYDVVTIVGEGEPTLYRGLGQLIEGVKALTDKPVAVITNGALLTDPAVAAALMEADIVLPSLDAYDEASFKRIDRPVGSIRFEAVQDALRWFTRAYPGELWLEIMLVAGMNDSDEALSAFQAILRQLRYDRLYINAPVRPPAEQNVEAPSKERMARAVELLSGVSIDMLTDGAFDSEIADDFEATLSIIRRHPMNQHEIESFIRGRGGDPAAILARLAADPAIEAVAYKGYTTYRFQ